MPPTTTTPAMSKNSSTWARKVTGPMLRGRIGISGQYPRSMEPGGAGDAQRGAWRPGIPSIREFLPSLLFGAAVPIGVYFVVRHHVSSDTQALIIAGCFSVAYILIEFVRQRTV